MRSSAVEWKELGKTSLVFREVVPTAATTACFRRSGRTATPVSLGIEPDEMDASLYISLNRPYELADRLAAYAREVA
jgi:hypothetical protein